MKKTFITMILCLAAAQILHAEELFTGDVYLQGTNRGVLLFTQENSVERKGGQLILRHVYTAVDGSLGALEEVVYDKGKLAAYKVEMPDTGCGCLLERRDNVIVFSFTRGNDQKRESDYDDDIVMGPTLRDFIVKNWDALYGGKPVYFKLPAMNLQRVAEFQLLADTRSRYAREGVLVLRMKIANYLLRVLVDPVDLVMDVRTKRMVEIHGKSLLTRKVNGKIENPAVDIYYRYK